MLLPADPTRGVFILTYLFVVVGGSLLLFAIRAPGMVQGSNFAGLSRETLLLVNNLLLVVIAAMVLTGTLYPLLLDALDAGKISVGPPYFGTLFALLLVPIGILLPMGFYAKWQEDQPGPAAQGTGFPGAYGGAGCRGYGVLAAGSRRLGHRRRGCRFWIIASCIRYYRQRLSAGKGSRPSRSETGMILAHLGVGIFLIGASLTNAVSSEKHLRMVPGDSFELAGYNFVFEGTRRLRGPNYMADEGEFIVYKDGDRVTSLFPQKRSYPNGQVMTEAALDPGLTRDLYVSLGESLDDSGTAWAIRIYHKPFIRFIWMGALMMMAGGFLAASDRRYRRRRRLRKHPRAGRRKAGLAEAPA